MARSVGEAAANGLESGFRLGMDVVQQRRNNERQDRLDQQHSEGLALTQERQKSQDALAAIDAQEKELAREGTAMASSATPPTPEQQQSFAERVKGLQSVKQQHLSKVSGYDLNGARKAAKVDVDDIIKSGDNVAALKPGQLTRAMTVSTGRPPTDFLHTADGPAPVQAAGQDFIEGLQANDQQRMLKGVNIMYAPMLKKGIGTPGAQGGTIVGKQIINLVPDPNSTEDDPKVVPMLRVYVNNGKDFRGPREAGVPEGATGHYDAPLTKNRSSDPGDPVQSIGMKEAMDFIGQNMHVVELLNQPGAIAKLQEDQQAGAWDPQEYLSAQQALGIQAPKASVKETIIPAGGTLHRTVSDRNGNVVSETNVQGNAKAATGQAALIQKAQDLADANGTSFDDEYQRLNEARRGKEDPDEAEARIRADKTLTENEKKVQIRALRTGIKPGKYTGDGGGAGGGKGLGGGGAGDAGISPGENRRLQRLNDSLKADQDQVKEDKREVQRTYEKKLGTAKDIINPAKRKAAEDAAEAEYKSGLDELKKRDIDISARRSNIQDKLEGVEPDKPKDKGLATTKAGASSKAAPAAPAKPVLKFDKAGNRVTG